MSIQRPLAVILIVALLLSTGCTSTRPVRVATPAQPTWDVKPGETVIVQTPDGERWRFEVEQIDGDTIVARGGTRFPRDNVVHLWRQSVSTSKTAALIAGMAGMLFVMFGIAAAAAVDDQLSGR